jgi:hypothetical protein
MPEFQPNHALAKRKLEAEARRVKAVDLYLHSDKNQKMIGEELGVSKTTISKYITSTRKIWYEKCSLKQEEHIAEELQKLREREAEALKWLAGLGPVEGDPDTTRRNSREAVKWEELLLKIAARKAALLGLDKPKQLDIKNDQPVTINLIMADCSQDDRDLRIIEHEALPEGAEDEEEGDF